MRNKIEEIHVHLHHMKNQLLSQITPNVPKERERSILESVKNL